MPSCLASSKDRDKIAFCPPAQAQQASASIKCVNAYCNGYRYAKWLAPMILLRQWFFYVHLLVHQLLDKVCQWMAM
jgi:hypothetical protein